MLNRKQFREYLALYGADVESWPEHFRAAGIDAKNDPAMASILREHGQLESLLRSRTAPPAPPDLAERIIARTQRTPQPKAREGLSWLQELLGAVALPHPAFAVAATLLVGFIIGVAAPAIPGSEQDVAMQNDYDDDGVIL